MFVGDSIQRGQFDSMVCMLQSAIPDGKKSLDKVPSKKIFYAQARMVTLASSFFSSLLFYLQRLFMINILYLQEYNATIEFYWAPFIVESNSDHSTNHTVIKRLVKLDRIAHHSENWQGVDYLVFETYVWWMYKPIINVT